MKGILGIIYVVLVIIGLLDCIKSNKDKGKKILWVLLIIFIPYAGVIAYYLVGRK